MILSICKIRINNFIDPAFPKNYTLSKKCIKIVYYLRGPMIAYFCKKNYVREIAF